MALRGAAGAPDPTADTVVIAGWTLDASSHCLIRGSERRKLEPKTTQLLAFFASHPGMPLRRRELLESVWPGVIVGDEALTAAVNKIRRAFDDDRRHPRVIETIPKMGYRLIATVSHVDSGGCRATPPVRHGAPDDSGSTSPQASVRVRPMGRYLGLAAAGVALLLAAVVVFDRWPQTEPEAPALPTPGETPQPLVQVLPFTVLGDEPGQQYLARGLTADLIARLSRLSGLHVSGAGTHGIEEHEVARNRYAIWGGIRRDGQMLVIEIRLSESASGRQLWVQRYDRPFADLFEIQQEIGTQLAQALSLRLTETELQRIAHRYTTSVAAYDLFLRAQSELLVRSALNNARARDLYLQAIAMDPAFARAYGGLALIHAGNYRNQWAVDPEHELERALSYANSAIEIDPTLPELYWVLGYVKAQQRRHDEAVTHLDNALRLDPGFADAMALKGGIMTYLGKPRETIALLRRAMRLNPEAGYLYFMTLGRAYFFLSDFEQAEINLREALSRNPSSLEVHVYLAAALQLAGKPDDAEWQADEIHFIEPDFMATRMLATYPMTDSEQITMLTSALDELGL